MKNEGKIVKVDNGITLQRAGRKVVITDRKGIKDIYGSPIPDRGIEAFGFLLKREFQT